jgi:hypothetical protein
LRGLPKEQRAFARNQHNLDVSRLLRKREGLRGLLHYLRNSMADRHKKKRVYNFLKKKKKEMTLIGKLHINAQRRHTLRKGLIGPKISRDIC